MITNNGPGNLLFFELEAWKGNSNEHVLGMFVIVHKVHVKTMALNKCVWSVL
jgi:hypothetical protein